MATMKKGILLPAPQWWKHLRKWKRVFWKRHRKAERNIKENSLVNSQSGRTLPMSISGPLQCDRLRARLVFASVWAGRALLPETLNEH